MPAALSTVLLPDIYDRGEDKWTLFCEQGRIAAARIEQGKWVIGLLARHIVRGYGDKAIERFAVEINMPKRDVYRYHEVCVFYGFKRKSDHVDYFAERPTLTYSHLREAKRVDHYETAMLILEQASEESWVVEHVHTVVNEILGISREAPTDDVKQPTSAFGAEITSLHTGYNFRPRAWLMDKQIVLPDAPDALIAGIQQGKSYTVIFEECEP